jgi:carbonic anhydrase/acetyltransferase-like protein (isoleucine patch superfamily)
MPAYQLGTRIPQIDPTAYIAPGAQVIGHVILKPASSIWFNASLRGDNEPIEIGEGSNVQESAVLHTDPGCPLTIGRQVTVGHQAMLHGCIIADESLIGMQAIVLNGAQIGRHCIIGAGALVTSNMVVPDGSLVMGSPGKIMRPVRAEEIAKLIEGAANYSARAIRFRETLQELGR